MGSKTTKFVPTEATTKAVLQVCAFMAQTGPSFAPAFDAVSNPAPRHNNI